MLARSILLVRQPSSRRDRAPIGRQSFRAGDQPVRSTLDASHVGCAVQRRGRRLALRAIHLRAAVPLSVDCPLSPGSVAESLVSCRTAERAAE
jgi:hypothetical protein